MHNNLKFDLRVYVLITGCNPLRVFMYRDGLVRFATQPYEKVTELNKMSNFMHLTNFAINKENPNFVSSNSHSKKEDRSAHKRSIIDFFKELQECGYKTKDIWNQMKDIVIKTICSIQPILKHNYLSCNSDDPFNQTCFELLGFDILIDENMKPYLLEVNHSPSFRVESKVDMKVKKNLIYDTFRILNVSLKEKKKLKNLLLKNCKLRTLTGRRVKLSDGPMKEKCIKERDGFCNLNNGKFEKLFPPRDQKMLMTYTGIMQEAENIYHRFTGAGDVAKIRGLERLMKKASNIELPTTSIKKAQKVYTKSTALSGNYRKKILRNNRSSIFERRKNKLKKILASRRSQEKALNDKNNSNLLKNMSSFNAKPLSPRGLEESQEVVKSAERMTRSNKYRNQTSTQEILELEKMIEKREKKLDIEIKKVTDKIEKFEINMKLRIKSGRKMPKNKMKTKRPMTTSQVGSVISIFNGKKGKGGGSYLRRSEYPGVRERVVTRKVRSRSNNRTTNKSKMKGGKKFDPYVAWDPFKSFDKTYKQRMRSLGIKLVGAGQIKR